MAEALKKLKDMSHGVTFEQIADTIGMTRMEVWRYLSLLNLVPEVQEMVSKDEKCATVAWF